jgi:hypothetical protein
VHVEFILKERVLWYEWNGEVKMSDEIWRSVISSNRVLNSGSVGVNSIIT